jgi:hypothetical protein
MKNWFEDLWKRLRLAKLRLKYRWLEFRGVKIRPSSLEEYSDSQITALLLAGTAYGEAKKNPAAFVDKYFAAKIRPSKSKDSWLYDLVVSDRDGSGAPCGFSWDGCSGQDAYKPWKRGAENV